MPTRPVVCTALVLATATALAAQRPLRTFYGTQPGALFGRAVAAAADRDGDGVRDLVIGEPAYALGTLADCGAVRLVSTGSGTTLAFSLGLLPGYQLGSTVAGVGDVDGDGFADFAAGAPLAGAYRHGFVRIASGRNGLPIAEITGENRSELGTSLCAGGDLDLDGRAEVLIASPHNSNVRPYGRVQAFDFRGIAQWQFVGGNFTDMGHSLATVGDIDGDGHPDYVAGEPGFDFGGPRSGRVYMLRSNTTGGMARIWDTYLIYYPGDEGGRVVAAAGDVDGDGTPDVLVGDGRQRVRLLSGRDGAQLAQVTNPAFLGNWTLAGIGDWNGDGRRDFAVGVPTANLARGQVLVYSTNPMQLLATLDGELASGFGAALAGVGDVDGDGRDDFAVGAPGLLVNGQSLGRVTVHGFDIAPAAVPFGTGCSSPLGTPGLYVAGTPLLGTQFDLRCSNVQPNFLAAWLFGWSSTQIGTTPLPVDLGSYGMLGCQLLVSAEASQLQVPANSYASWTVVLPPLPQLAGLQFHAQLAQVQPLRAGGFVWSDGMRVTLGNR